MAPGESGQAAGRAAEAGRDRRRGADPRETISGDLGWASGHVAVATALGVSLSSMAPTWTRPLFAAVIAATGFGRMYVGAHLPLDLIGGLGLGMMCVVAVRILRRAPDANEAVAAR